LLVRGDAGEFFIVIVIAIQAVETQHSQVGR